METKPKNREHDEHEHAIPWPPNPSPWTPPPTPVFTAPPNPFNPTPPPTIPAIPDIPPPPTDDTFERNSNIEIGSIIGAVVLLVIVLLCCYRWRRGRATRRALSLMDQQQAQREKEEQERAQLIPPPVFPPHAAQSVVVQQPQLQNNAAVEMFSDSNHGNNYINNSYGYHQYTPGVDYRSAPTDGVSMATVPSPPAAASDPDPRGRATPSVSLHQQQQRENQEYHHQYQDQFSTETTPASAQQQPETPPVVDVVVDRGASSVRRHYGFPTDPSYGKSPADLPPTRPVSMQEAVNAPPAPAGAALPPPSNNFTAPQTLSTGSLYTPAPQLPKRTADADDSPEQHQGPSHCTDYETKTAAPLPPSSVTPVPVTPSEIARDGERRAAINISEAAAALIVESRRPELPSHLKEAERSNNDDDDVYCYTGYMETSKSAAPLPPSSETPVPVTPSEIARDGERRAAINISEAAAALMMKPYATGGGKSTLSVGHLEANHVGHEEREAPPESRVSAAGRKESPPPPFGAVTATTAVNRKEPHTAIGTSKRAKSSHSSTVPAAVPGSDSDPRENSPGAMNNDDNADDADRIRELEHELKLLRELKALRSRKQRKERDTPQSK